LANSKAFSAVKGRCIYVTTNAIFICSSPSSHTTFLSFHLITLVPVSTFYFISHHFEMKFITPLTVASILATSVAAHPGHDARHEMEERAAFMQTSKRDLSHCAAKMKARGLDHSSIQRRAAVARAARRRRNIAADTPYLKARDEATVLNTTHLSSENYSNATDESVIFSGNNSCILSPEVTQGPYCE
jgi:hypothetical protein